jgi:hypothetical protein
VTGVVSDPLGDIVRAAAAGRFPPEDGGITVVPPDRTTGLWAVVCFSAHAVVATSRPRDEVLACGLDAYGGAHDPEALVALAGPGAWFGVLDAVLVATAGSVPGVVPLAPTDAYDDHQRVTYARRVRVDVEVLGDERGLVTLGRGLGGRTELGFELAGDAAPGTGRALLAGALAAHPEGELVFASCSPGNARSLRALLAAGFRPIGSECLIRPAGA